MTLQDSKHGKKKICVFLGNRAHYTSLKPIMKLIQADQDLELLLFVGASALLDKFGEVAKDIEADGFTINEYIYMLLEGGTPTTMAKSTGMGLNDMANLLYKHKPDLSLLVGDRFEMMAFAIASAFMNIPIAHTMGGEVTGTIDESIRHAITKLSHIHFPANELAKENIIRMGENPAYVFNVGCPRMDAIKEILQTNCDAELKALIKSEGVGDVFDVNGRFLLISQHPVTTEYGSGEQQINETLNAISDVQEEFDVPVIYLWPNPDAGTEDIARGVRKMREKQQLHRFHAFKNLPLHIYTHLLNRTLCLVGNTSSGLRDGAFLGTPVVNIGSRQNGRQRGRNVIDVPHERRAIKDAIIAQIKKSDRTPDPVYGDGNASMKIVAKLKELNVSPQKRLHYS